LEKTLIVAAACFLILLFTAAHAIEAEGTDFGDESGPVLKFTIPEHDLYPENIAYDEISGDYFLGSMSQSRIIRIHDDGSYEDFLSSSASGLSSSIGMKVDAVRRVLWVCTGRFTLYADYDAAPAMTGVLSFNVDDATPVDKWLLEQESDYHIFNDVALAANGDAYATTTLLGTVYKIPAGGGEWELILQLDAGSHNNGITLDRDGQYLFLTIDRSIYRMDLETRDLVELVVPEGEALGTDGLYFHDNSLVSMKPRFNRISQLFLNEDFSAADRVEVLAQDHEDFAYPTTGVLVGDKLVFVATSFANVPRNTESAQQHSDVLIYEVGLKQR